MKKTYDMVQCGSKFQVICNETKTKTIALSEAEAANVCLSLRANPGMVSVWAPPKSETD